MPGSIINAQTFVVGNKRTAFVMAVTFLHQNGWEFRLDPVVRVKTMDVLAAHEASEALFTDWLNAGLTPNRVFRARNTYAGVARRERGRCRIIGMLAMLCSFLAHR